MFGVAWSSGSQAEHALLHKDDRHRYVVLEASGRFSEPVGSWRGRVPIDEEGR